MCVCVRVYRHVYVLMSPPIMAALSGYCVQCLGRDGVRENWARTLVPKAGPWMDALAA